MQLPKQQQTYADETPREGMAIKCIVGDGAEELGISVRFQRMLTDRGIRRKSSAPRTPNSGEVAECAIQQLILIARSQLVKAGRREDCLFFDVADAACKTARMFHNILETKPYASG